MTCYYSIKICLSIQQDNLSLFLAMPTACGSSQVRELTLTQATMVTTPQENS